MSAGLRARAEDLDPAVWPARAWVLLFALLLRTPHNTVVARMRRAGLSRWHKSAIAWAQDRSEPGGGKTARL